MLLLFLLISLSSFVILVMAAFDNNQSVSKFLLIPATFICTVIIALGLFFMIVLESYMLEPDSSRKSEEVKKPLYELKYLIYDSK